MTDDSAMVKVQEELRLLPNIERLAGLVTVDQYFMLRDNDPETVIEVLSQFVIDENGEYISKEEGRKQIGKVKLGSVMSVYSKFMTDTEEIAVPLGNGKV